MYKKKRSFLFVVLILVFLSLPAVSETVQQPNHKQAEVSSKVIQVLDGDTIKLANGIEVRYLGLDTPETNHPEKPVEFFGYKATDYNKKLVAGERVKLEYDIKKKDQYNRVLTYVYVKREGTWINVNAELLREGYARTYTIPPNVKYSDYLLEVENKARKNCRGLW